MPEVTLFVAFTAGLLSFLSPCVLPLIPAYISFIAGISIDELHSQEIRPAQILGITINSVIFVLGFSLVFIALGASATTLGDFLLGKLDILGKIAGGIIILFGLHLTHIMPLKFLYYEKKMHFEKKPFGYIGSLLVGAAFAFGWTPCIGPILAGILAYAGTQDTLNKGIMLLAAYSLGLGIPFILTGLSINTFLMTFNRIKKHLGLIEKISGFLLIIVGILILTNNFTILTGYLTSLE